METLVYKQGGRLTSLFERRNVTNHRQGLKLPNNLHYSTFTLLNLRKKKRLHTFQSHSLWPSQLIFTIVYACSDITTTELSIVEVERWLHGDERERQQSLELELMLTRSKNMLTYLLLKVRSGIHLGYREVVNAWTFYRLTGQFFDL